MEVTMSKADDGLTTSANPTPTRRGILSGTARLAGAAVLGYATLHPAEALAAVTHMAPANENKGLIEYRGLCDLLAVTRATLDKMAKKPGFPKRIRLGRFLYVRLADIKTWVETR
jgi:predicted DNA-binding transcriptional regulator AlpA